MKGTFLSPLAAMTWLREHNGWVRFETDGTVTVCAHDRRRHRKTWRLALSALIKGLASGPGDADEGE